MSEPKNENKEEKLILENEWKGELSPNCALLALGFAGDKASFMTKNPGCSPATKIKDPTPQRQPGDGSGAKGTESDLEDKRVGNANDGAATPKTSTPVNRKKRKKRPPLTPPISQTPTVSQTPPPPPKDVKKPESKANGNKPCVQQFEEYKNGDIRQSLWIKELTLANQDEVLAEANYLKVRAREIRDSR